VNNFIKKAPVQAQAAVFAALFLFAQNAFCEDLDALWASFMENQNSGKGAEILIEIGKLGKGNRLVIDSVNNYLMEQNLFFVSGGEVDYAMVSAAIAAVMELGDSSSYPALFTVLLSSYPEMIASEAQGAMDVIPGNLKQFLFDIIQNGPVEEKYIAFMAGVNSWRLTIPELGQLAELALEHGLAASAASDGAPGDGSDSDSSAALSAMRYTAVMVLTPLRWTRANALAIRNYQLAQADFQRGAISKTRFLEAVALLGTAGNSDAALILGLQLGLTNARVGRGIEFDPQITLAIVQSLGYIGDRAAFTHLQQVGNLPYPENIKAAAREAMVRLKW